MSFRKKSSSIPVIIQVQTRLKPVKSSLIPVKLQVVLDEILGNPPFLIGKALFKALARCRIEGKLTSESGIFLKSVARAQQIWC